MEALKVCVLLNCVAGLIEANDYTGNHSLIIFVTFAPGHSFLPEYTSYGMLDDLRVFHYESNSRTFSSPLKHHTSLSSVWRDLEACTTFKSGFFRRFIRDANSTLGLKGPILQLIYGCTLDEEGNQRGLYHFSVNGEHSLTLDQDSMSWSTYHPQAVGLKDILDGFKIWNRNNLMYIKQDCVPRLKKFYEHGKATINRKDHPEVAIMTKAAEATVVLTCVATGFYPREILVTWEQDGKSVSANVMSTDILPNHDLTYQVHKSLEIRSGDKHKYSCRVEHSSLTDPLRVHWDPSEVGLSPKHIGLIALFGFTAVVLLTVCVYVCLKRRQG